MKKLGLILVVLVLIVLAGVWLILSNLSDLTRSFVEEKVPGLTFDQLEVGWNHVQLSRVEYSTEGKVRLKTEALHIESSLLTGWGDTLRINSIQIEKPYVYVERRENGSVLWPIPGGGETGGSENSEGTSSQAVYVKEVRIQEGSGEFLDRSVGPPHAQYRIRSVNLTLEDLHYPQVSGPVPVDLSLAVGGKKKTRVSGSGWIDTQDESALMGIRIENLYLLQLKPYYQGQIPTKLSDGTLSTQAQWSMEQGSYTLSGQMSIEDLKFQSTGKGIAGLALRMVESSPKAGGGTLVVPFEIKGNLDGESNVRGQLVKIAANALIQKMGLNPSELLAGKEKAKLLDETKKILNPLKKQVDQIKGLFR